MSEKKEKPIKVTRISLKEFEKIEERNQKPNSSEKWDKILREVQKGRALKVEGLSRGEILTLIRYIKRKHLPVRHVCSLKEGVIYLAPSVVLQAKTKEEAKKEEAKKEEAKKSTKKAKEKEAKEEAKETPAKVEPTA
jgi:mannitol-specific phosphotransferase system IIBC component